MLADRFATALFYVASITAIVTFTAWSLLSEAVVRTVTLPRPRKVPTSAA